MLKCGEAFGKLALWKKGVSVLMVLQACLPWQPHLFCPSPYTQLVIAPRVTTATGDICRSSLSCLTKALRT